MFYVRIKSNTKRGRMTFVVSEHMTKELAKKRAEDFEKYGTEVSVFEQKKLDWWEYLPVIFDKKYAFVKRPKEYDDDHDNSWS